MTKFIRSVMSSQKTIKIVAEYKLLSIEHRENTKNYKKQQSALKEMIKYIQTTISSKNATFIQKVVTHSYDLLIALKQN